MPPSKPQSFRAPRPLRARSSAALASAADRPHPGCPEPATPRQSSAQPAPRASSPGVRVRSLETAAYSQSDRTRAWARAEAIAAVRVLQAIVVREIQPIELDRPAIPLDADACVHEVVYFRLIEDRLWNRAIRHVRRADAAVVEADESGQGCGPHETVGPGCVD